MKNSEIYDGIMDCLQSKLDRDEIGITEAENIAEYAYQVYILECVEDEILEPIFPDFETMGIVEFTETVSDFLDEFDNVVTEDYQAKSAQEYLQQGYDADKSHKRDVTNEKDRRRLISRAYKADYAKYKEAEDKKNYKDLKGKEKYIRDKIDKDGTERMARASVGYNGNLRGLERKMNKSEADKQNAINSLKSGDNGFVRVAKVLNPMSKENRTINKANNDQAILSNMADKTRENRDRRMQDIGKMSQTKYDIIMRRMKNGKGLSYTSKYREKDANGNLKDPKTYGTKVNSIYGKSTDEFKRDAKNEKIQMKQNKKIMNRQVAYANKVAAQQERQNKASQKYDMKMAKQHGDYTNQYKPHKSIKDTVFDAAQNVAKKVLMKKN